MHRWFPVLSRRNGPPARHPAGRTGRLAAAVALGLAAAGGQALPAPAVEAAPPAAAAAERLPVVFVHGLYGSASNFDTMKQAFQRAGYPSNQLHAFGYNSLGDMRTAANQLRTQVDQLLARTGARQVDIVTHSLGGLPSRWYIKELGSSAKVRTWYSLSGPNQGGARGTCPAPFAFVCQQAVQGSSFIRQLNSGDPTPGDTRYFTAYSACDGVVDQAWTRLEGATAVDLGCIDHFSMLRDAGVANGVITALGSAPGTAATG